jgi:hypothetical protein
LSLHCAFLDLGFWFCSCLFVLCTYWITSWNLFCFGLWLLSSLLFKVWWIFHRLWSVKFYIASLWSEFQKCYLGWSEDMFRLAYT